MTDGSQSLSGISPVSGQTKSVGQMDSVEGVQQQGSRKLEGAILQRPWGILSNKFSSPFLSRVVAMKLE